ncbi:PREDICTED: uncharacterized protein LOC106106493 [Papilio polytes]|uniref:uncharacterized protein LOC106106493 n=1 Tax=Papilio polytes TaxID=76194 RepID=UPI00067669DE|nr:PREDICTED: uncharacterized protein LOC106106493 [Papilio polytes]
MAIKNVFKCAKEQNERRKTLNMFNIIKTSVILILMNTNKVNCNENVTEEIRNIEKDIPRRLKLLESISGRSLNSVYQNGTFNTGNKLWDNILNECTFKPSVSCLQKNVYSYLDESLDFSGDVNVASGMCFKKNNVDINKYSKEANIIYVTGSKKEDSDKRSLDEENEINHQDESETPLEEVTDALYDKGVKFLMEHDLKMTLPELFFHETTLKISPRALTKTGALVHIDLEPKEDVGQGRIFFHKIKKYIKKKLVMAALAIILVVKLIALKLIFVLPLVLGVSTAKKMFLKFLLFLFPALSHIFKLCSWYHQNYHTTKYHHHHHLITHHHHKAPYAPAYGHPSHVAVKPHVEHHPHTLDYNTQDWELSGPGLGSEYIGSDIHRNAIANFKPHANDINDINSWGLGLPPGQANIGDYASSNNAVPNVVAAPSGGHKVPPGSPIRPVGPPNPYYRNKKATARDPEKEALIRAASLAARAPASPVRDEILRVSQAKLTETNRVKAETELVRQQQEILASQDPDTVAAERFYGALLEKVDTILTPMGANDIGCRERAVCAMYSDPFKHSPYSNLVSNELSKDSSELVPPADSKMALRYYRYVQAARDGQEQKDCTLLYPQCNINYNQK